MWCFQCTRKSSIPQGRPDSPPTFPFFNAFYIQKHFGLPAQKKTLHYFRYTHSPHLFTVSYPQSLITLVKPTFSVIQSYMFTGYATEFI